MAKSQTMHEVERGELLRYLSEFFQEGQGVTLKFLLHHMDDSAYTVTEDELEFHLQYLAEKGMVSIEEHARRVGEKRRIKVVKITARGVDRLDNRPATNDGVRI